ncbi:hypothetical protein ID858_18150, partial [Xenorhabdus sp. DI]
ETYKTDGYIKTQNSIYKIREPNKLLKVQAYEADDDSDDDYPMTGLMKHSKDQLTEYYAIGLSLPANEYYPITGIDVAQMAYELLEAREKLAAYENMKRECDDNN